MGYTVNQIAVSLVKEFGGDVTTDLDKIEQAETYISDVYGKILKRDRWPWLVSTESLLTVAGTAQYSLSSVASEVREARIVDPPTVLRYRERIELGPIDLTRQAKPLIFWNGGYDPVNSCGLINLFPVPDGIYQIDLQTLLRPIILASTAIIPIPLEYIDILKDGVRYYMQKDDKEAALMQLSRQDYDVEIERLKKGRVNQTGRRGRMGYSDIGDNNRSWGPFLDPAHYRDTE